MTGRVTRTRDERSEKSRLVGASRAGFRWELSDQGVTDSGGARKGSVPALRQEVVGRVVRRGWVCGRCWKWTELAEGCRGCVRERERAGDRDSRVWGLSDGKDRVAFPRLVDGEVRTWP